MHSETSAWPSFGDSRHGHSITSPTTPPASVLRGGRFAFPRAGDGRDRFAELCSRSVCVRSAGPPVILLRGGPQAGPDTQEAHPAADLPAPPAAGGCPGGETIMTGLDSKWMGILCRQLSVAAAANDVRRRPICVSALEPTVRAKGSKRGHIADDHGAPRGASL